MHEDYVDRAKLYKIIDDKFEVYVLSPIDLVISKILRFSDAKNGWTWPPITEILGQIKRFYLDTKNGKYLDTFLDKPLNQFYLS